MNAANFHADFSGGDLNLLWALPFCFFIVMLALAPLLFENLWHKHATKIVFFTIFTVILALTLQFGGHTARVQISYTLLHHYIPFIFLIGALFIVCGGIHITMKGLITPFGNVIFLFFGSLLASLIGTTGASILLIRPFLMLNHHRFRKKHLVIFFIFLISNVGGCLTPIGDPPLFLGYLNGIDFFWATQNLWVPYLLFALPLLAIFYFFDKRYFKNDTLSLEYEKLAHDSVKLYGGFNILFIAGILTCIIFSSANVESYHLLRDVGLAVIAGLSFWLTPKNIRHMNRFSFAPLKEVALVFAAIFITLIPIQAMLDAGKMGAFGDVIKLTSPGGTMDPFRYYLTSGVLSAFLDNAPTYLLFFHMAGGNAADLMNFYSNILIAISTGSVFFGALTYIGNAPNFMVKTMAERMEIRMPSFLGYMGWSTMILAPLLLVFGLYYFL